MCPGGALRMSNGESLKARADHLCLVYLALGLSPTPAQSGEGKAMSNIIPFPRKSPMQAASLADSVEMPDVIEARRPFSCNMLQTEQKAHHESPRPESGHHPRSRRHTDQRLA